MGSPMSGPLVSFDQAIREAARPDSAAFSPSPPRWSRSKPSPSRRLPSAGINDWQSNRPLPPTGRVPSNASAR
jgi:hypothetical protein